MRILKRAEDWRMYISSAVLRTLPIKTSSKFKFCAKKLGNDIHCRLPLERDIMNDNPKRNTYPN